MASVNLTRAVSTVYLVHPDDLPGPDDGLEQDALISKTDVKEETDANGQEWLLLEHADSKDLLNGQKVPIGLVSKENVEQVSVHNWAAFGFKTKEVASDQFIFHEDNNPLFKALCEELNGDTKDKNGPKPDVPGISRLMHDAANHLKLSRWVYKHASEWGGEADYKKQVKDFLENGAQDSEDAKEMARRKYDRLEAKIANLSWWPEVSSKVKGFPSSAVVHHFNPAAFLEQMRRVEGGLKLIWGAKVSLEFRNKVEEISGLLNCDPNHLMACMALETGETFDPAITNSLGYTGLIQIGSSAAKDINRRKGTNITTADLRVMSDVEQLTYVYYYLEPFTGKLTCLAAFYLAILFPADVKYAEDDNHIVFDKDSSSKVRKNAYAQNPLFHKESPESGKTYVWEIRQEIDRFFEKGKSFINE